jgi:hypothetical protein
VTDAGRAADAVTLPPAHTDSTDFPTYVPVTASADFAEFVSTMRRFQDLVSSSDPDDYTWRSATVHLNALTALLEPHQAAEGRPPAGRALELPGMGNPLLPPWRITAAGPDGTTLHGHFSRYYLGANGIVLGGALPLLFDWTFAIAVTAAGRPLSRTGYLNIDYRKPTRIDTDLTVAAQVIDIDGRKTTLTAALTDAEGTVLAEAETLMIGLQAHQQ